MNDAEVIELIQRKEELEKMRDDISAELSKVIERIDTVSNSDLREIAIILHDLFCLYEIQNDKHDWNLSIHTRWYNLACGIVKKTNIEPEKVLAMLKDVQYIMRNW